MAETFLIIGDGVFGLSTSCYLQSQGYQFRICAKAEAQAPSQDIAKISRTDYAGLLRMKEAQAAHKLWTTDKFYRRFCAEVGRVVAYDFENSPTLRMINENRQRYNLEQRETLGPQSFTEAFGGVQTSDLEYVYNNDDALIDWASVMKSLHSAVEAETAPPVRRLIPGPNRVDAVIVDHPVCGEETYDTKNVKIILAAGPWAMTILDRSGINGPPAGLSLTALLAFHLAIDDEQYAFYSAKPIFSHIGTGEILPPVSGQKVMKVTWTKRPFITASDWLLCPPDLSRSAFVAREAQAMRRWLLQSHPRLRKARVTTHFYWDAMAPRQVPYIAKHPQYSNLTIAAGGSYTHGKDLPTIGQSIVEAAEGQLKEASMQRHGWQRSENFNEPDSQPLLSTGQAYETLEKEARKHYERIQEDLPDLSNFFL